MVPCGISLNPETLSIEPDRVDVHPTLATSGDFHSHWKPVRFDGVAETVKSDHAGLVIAGVHCQIQIAMRARFGSHEGVDAPPAGYPVTDRRALQRFKNFEGVFPEHRSTLRGPA